MMKNYRLTKMNISAVQRPKIGKTCCGDSYFFKETEDYLICVLADGLGSGSEAKKASERAIAVVKEHHHEDLAVLMKACNKELRFGRGAVLSMFKIKFDARELIFSGVGNVRFIFYSSSGKKISPMPTLGFLAGKPLVPKIQTFPFDNNISFAMYSDGLDVNLGRKTIFYNASPEEAAKHVQQIVMQDDSNQDDVTFLYGKYIGTDEVE